MLSNLLPVTRPQYSGKKINKKVELYSSGTERSNWKRETGAALHFKKTKKKNHCHSTKVATAAAEAQYHQCQPHRYGYACNSRATSDKIITIIIECAYTYRIRIICNTSGNKLVYLSLLWFY